jgi:hypothetical protein
MLFSLSVPVLMSAWLDGVWAVGLLTLISVWSYFALNEVANGCVTKDPMSPMNPRASATSRAPRRGVLLRRAWLRRARRAEDRDCELRTEERLD